MVRDIGNYFTKAEFNNDTGKLILSNEDGSNTKEITIQEQVDMQSLQVKPKIYTRFDNHAIDGSFCIIDNGKEVYVKVNEKWKLLYKDNDKTLLRVPYYDETLQYSNKNVVGYMFKKYKSIVDTPTVGQTPDTINYDYSFIDGEEVTGSALFNINNIHVENGKLIIVATDYIYKLVHDEVVVYNRTAEGVDTKAITIAGVEYRIISDRIVESRTPDDVKNKIYFDEPIISITGDDFYLYAYSKDAQTVYMVNTWTQEQDEFITSIDIDCDDITINSSFIYFVNYSTNKIWKYDLVSSQLEEYDLEPNTTSIAATEDGRMYYHVNGEDFIRIATVQSGEWMQVSDEYFFKRFNCPQPFMHRITYENVIDENRYHYTDKYINVAFFCFMSNKYFYAIENNTRGRLIQYDISNGVFNERYTGKYLDIGVNVGGIAYFQGELIVARWQSLIIIDPVTLTVIREVDLQNKIEDAKITGMTQRGDTLYVMTTNNKIYKFQDVDAPVSGTVTLELYSGTMRICAINSSELYCMIDRDIWNLSLDDGSIIEKTPLGRNMIVDIDLMNYELFTLELEGSNTLMKYKTMFTLVEG